MWRMIGMLFSVMFMFLRFTVYAMVAIVRLCVLLVQTLVAAASSSSRSRQR